MDTLAVRAILTFNPIPAPGLCRDRRGLPGEGFCSSGESIGNNLSEVYILRRTKIRVLWTQIYRASEGVR